MRRLRIPIFGLMVAVLLAAAGFAAFRAGTESAFRWFYTLTIALLFFAALAARFGRQGARAFWFGFALVGWGYLLIGLGVRPTVEPVGMVADSSKALVNPYLGTTSVIRAGYDLQEIPLNAPEQRPFSVASGHVLATLVLAAIGGLVALVLEGVPTDQADTRSNAAPHSVPRPWRRAKILGLLVGLLVLAIGVKMYLGNTYGPYFPDMVFSKVKNINNRRVDSFAKYLERLKEPSLWKLAQSGTNDEVFRLLWVSSPDRARVVRVVKSRESVHLICVSLDSRLPSDPEDAIQRYKIELDPGDWDELNRWLAKADYWALPTSETAEPEAIGTRTISEEELRRFGRVFTSAADDDEERAIIEGISPGRYHVVHRSSPQVGPFLDLCFYLLRLAHLEEPSGFK